MAKAFSKSKHTLSISILKTSIFDDTKTFLWEKISNFQSEEKDLVIICQEVFYKKSKNKKESIKLYAFRLSDEYISYIKVSDNVFLYFLNRKKKILEF